MPLELIDPLRGYTETSSGFRSGDRIVPAEAGTGQEHLKTNPVLTGDQLNILSDSISEAESRLQVDGRPQAGELVEQEPPIARGPGDGNVVNGGVALRDVVNETWIPVPDPFSPEFSCDVF